MKDEEIQKAEAVGSDDVCADDSDYGSQAIESDGDADSEDDEDDGETSSGETSSGSEADESEESEDNDQAIMDAVCEAGLERRKQALARHMDSAERTEADNEFVEEFNDDQLARYVQPFDDLGYCELTTPERTETGKDTDYETLYPIGNGSWYNLKKKVRYRPTDFFDSDDERFAKTVRRHPRGPPAGLTFYARKLEAADAARFDDLIHKRLKGETGEEHVEGEDEFLIQEHDDDDYWTGR
jgi:hypothetical protein